MANLADGYYIVHNAVAPNLVLDKEADQVVNGTNIRLWARNLTDAQVIRVITARDGTRRMLFRDCGKAVDVAAANIDTEGANIQVFDSNNSRAQAITIVDAGGTIFYDGDEYSNYFLTWASGKVAAPADTTEGANVQLSTQYNDMTLTWFFEPIVSLRSGGSYRLLSMLNTKYCLEVASNSVSNGANVQLGVYNGKPHQVWYLVHESGTIGSDAQWSLRNPKTGRYMDVDSATAQAGTNVQVWDDNDTRAQRWNILSYGTTEAYQGTDYSTYRLGSFVTYDGWTYLLDVKNAETRADTNVQIMPLDVDHPDSTLFIFVPTDCEDPSLPTPHSLGLATNTGGHISPWQLQATVLYPTWYCSDAWTADGNNHYQYRYRTRSMNPTSSAWTSWSLWTAWDTAYVYKNGDYACLADGMEASFTWSQSKHRQIEFQVRAATTAENGAVQHGKAIDEVLDLYREPEITFTSAGFSPSGIRVAWTSDYTRGKTYITLVDITDSQGKSIIKKYMRLEGTGATASDEIPADNLVRWPNNNETIYIHYLTGYDQITSIPGGHTGNVTVSYDSGTTSVEPTIIEDGLNIYAKVPDLGTTNCWVKRGTDLFEAPEATDVARVNGYKIFDLPYPMGVDYDVLSSSVSASGAQWGTDITEMDATRTIAHAWTWDGGKCYLHKFTDLPTTEASYQPVYESNVLDARQFESVSFTNTVRSTLTATGALIHDGDHSDMEDVKALLAAHHAVYRDVNGGIHNVAITGVNVSRREKYDLVTIQMTEEAI